MTLKEKLFSVKVTPGRIVTRFLFMKFTRRNPKFSPKRLKKLHESKYPELLKEWFSMRMNGAVLDLDNPKTINEKIQWLKLYGNRKRMTELADKIAVRDFVAQTIGEKYLIPLVGVYNRAEDINWEELPSKFVLKPNHGSHWLSIIEDKSKIDIRKLYKTANKWLKENYAFYHGFEMQYAKIPPKLMIERHLGEITSNLNDYKVWCFNGVPKYIQVHVNRQGAGETTTCIYSIPEWKKQNFFMVHSTTNTCYQGEVPRPDCLDEMLDAAAKLSKEFPFVRVDFYCIDDGSIRFGEMTFTPASGSCPWAGEEDISLKLGAMIELPKKD